MKHTLVPAILAHSYDEFEAKVRFLEPLFDVAQIDIMDGVFVDNVTYADPQTIGGIETSLQYELHLMVDRPEEIIQQWHEVRNCIRYIVHYETFHKRKLDLYDILREIKMRGREVGIAINPNTTVSKVLEFLPSIDQLLVMGVTPGWSGQPFQSSVVEKITAIRRHYPKLPIAVDGGVTIQNYEKIFAAGANIIDSASMVFGLEGTPTELEKLIHTIETYRG